ncbi:TPA_asm: flagellar hook length control protein FliK [Salmonella enterica subsp. houtenae serovar 16:z4,z32:-]|uniref:Flagellar hook length control protein FliK n=1 Tax=Salmonella enterica subsp. houtenae serovar 16:z4,z32:- TaxID=1307497 RepID=A0A735L5I7_SALHO|nr:flagellar hook length control protein FliK [Salmonella enterica]ECE6508187.1 flagellar hook length control protein FliK [Salmonella enterica subsp. houtenae]EDS7538493.1 flagellar hook length control protein FliK [Salmonella enterica subsp. enterica]EGI6409240.1 flagellar hook length control protein FliK [Salmonella enterica subsp. houtenae serovar 16:z4,z32:-]ENZ86488.1 Flagellar hook-length control protein [Salmonella enterica subsp. houtenae serovar 16:z4,z32:-- str. RKS3027]QGF86879.1 f
MITLPQLITTDTDMTAGLTSGKNTGSAEDFLALLAGALGADGAQGKDARITLADLQAAGGKLSKGLLAQHGELGQAAKLADLLEQKANTTDETLTDLTQAQHLLSTLTPSLKTSALAALNKTAQHDEKMPALSDKDLASLSALFAMLPGQPVATPVAGETPTEKRIALPSLLRGEIRSAPQEETHTLSFSEHEKGKTEASLARVSDDRATGQSLTPQVVAAAATSAKVDVDSPPAPVTHGAAIPTLSSATAQPLPVASAPVLSAPLGSHEWQQAFSQQVVLFTRQGQQSAQLRLHPEELGQVHISLKLDDNQAQLQMVSPHSHVRAALEAALPMLRTQLAESGIQLGQSSISSESFAGQQHSSSQQQQSAHAQHADAFGAEDDIALALPVSLQAAARGNGAVDIFA